MLHPPSCIQIFFSSLCPQSFGALFLPYGEILTYILRFVFTWEDKEEVSVEILFFRQSYGLIGLVR
jgi:hypothetical protein